MDENTQSTAEPINRLIRELNKLPGIGPKSAQRMAFYLLRAPEESARMLADAVMSVKQQITLCSSCFKIDPLINFVFQVFRVTKDTHMSQHLRQFVVGKGG